MPLNFYHGPSDFDALESRLPTPWQVTEMTDPDRDGVTLHFPISRQIVEPKLFDDMRGELIENLAKHLFPDDPGQGTFDIGVLGFVVGAEQPEGAVEVDFEWPVPGDVPVLLESATAIIIDACISHESGQGAV